MHVTTKQLDNVLKEINEIFAKLDERIKQLEEANAKTTTRKTNANKEDA